MGHYLKTWSDDFNHPSHKPKDEPNSNLDSNPNLREGWVVHFLETWSDDLNNPSCKSKDEPNSNLDSNPN